MNLLCSSLFLVLLPFVCSVDGKFVPASGEDSLEDVDEADDDTENESGEGSVEGSEEDADSFEARDGLMQTHNVQILRSQRPLIQKIEVDIQLGHEIERNLTSMRELILVELEKCRTRRERIEFQQRLDRIDVIIRQVHTRTAETEVRFRAFLRRVSLGEIRTESQSHTLLQAIWSGYHTSLRTLMSHTAGYLRVCLRGITGALAHIGMGIQDVYRLKFQSLGLAIDAITNRGPF